MTYKTTFNLSVITTVECMVFSIYYQLCGIIILCCQSVFDLIAGFVKILVLVVARQKQWSSNEPTANKNR